ncbi:penicillin-binding protein 2 [gut metagenome]|uniref:Penicillin-binding protein 2 n=1 Tax=gut metagenome TaxID=749906 RepID=J9H2V8_9ZZZZ
MDIYTALNPAAQNELDRVMNGEIVPFPNEMLDIGTAIVNNTNGEIIAVGPGRHYHSDSVKQDNSINTRQPGSAMKPLLSYSSTFDILGWATTHIVEDKPKDYWHAGSNLRNSDGRYEGGMTLSKALGVSKNTTAAQAMLDLVDQTGLDYWVNFCKNLGFDTEVAERFVPQYCIGGADMYASPVQMASAYSIFANNGQRVNAHRVRRVIRRSDNAEIPGNTTTYDLISPAAAFMMSSLLREVVYGGYQNYNEILASPYYTAYGKSGTSSWEEEAVQYGIPPGVMKDEWSMGYTNTYTISTWSGYLPVYFMQGNYMNWAELQAATAFHINRHMLDFLAEGGNYAPIPRPEGVSDYNGGFIKSEFAARGDVTSGRLTPSSEELAAQKKEEDKKACEGSGGTYNEGTCSCPEGTELNGNACAPKDPTTENPEDPNGNDDPIINPNDPNAPIDPNTPIDPNAPQPDPNAPVEPIVPEEPITPDEQLGESAPVNEEQPASRSLTALAADYSDTLTPIHADDLLVLAPSKARLRAINQMIS